MTLEEFAKDAGVVTFDCGEGWGGKWGYYMTEFPNVHFCGYRTEQSTYKGWLQEQFGDTLSKSVLKLLKKASDK